MQDLDRERDEALVMLAQQGDKGATETILRRYMNPVRAQARRYFLAGGETDDLVQEGMIGLYAAIGNYRRETGKSFKNFAYLCVTRNITDAVRRNTRNKNVPLNNYVSLSDPDPNIFSEEESPEEFVIGREAQAEFRMKLMKELSDFEFRVMTMYLEGMSYAQICEATGKGEKSVDNALSRAKRKLQTAFGSND